MQEIEQGVKLQKKFYQRETIQVAQDLLGKILVHKLSDSKILSGRIVETEAYLGIHDPAAHSFNGRKTTRNAVMYEPGGLAYVYQIYGLHHCLNVVTALEQAEAVLIRAIEPIVGIEMMRRLRSVKGIHQLASGPGKLCQAFAINKSHNGTDLCGDTLFILDPKASYEFKIQSGPRIGIDYAGDGVFWPLRFAVDCHFCLSRPF